MVKVIDHQEWNEIRHITSIGIDDVKELKIFKDNGINEGKPLSLYLRVLQGFILYHWRCSRD
jgi:hypothetical protein